MLVNHPLNAAGAINTPISAVKPARIFAGLKIEAEIATKLAELAWPLEPYAVRLVPGSDIHLTLVPPWNESHIAGAVETLRIVANRFNRFLLTFSHLGYGPAPRHPRLLWAACPASSELKELQTALMAAYDRTDSHYILQQAQAAPPRLPLYHYQRAPAAYCTKPGL